MPQSIQLLKKRIHSVESARKVIRAMEMVSSAKLRRNEEFFNASHRYNEKISEILNNAFSDSMDFNHPLMRENKNTERVLLCVVAGDMGLCGSYNNVVLRTAEDFIKKNGKEEVDIIAIGKKTASYFKRRGYPLTSAILGMNGRLTDNTNRELNQIIIESFLSGKFKEFYMVYTNFSSSLKLKAFVDKILPVKKTSKAPVDIIFESEKDTFLEELVLGFVKSKIRLAILSAFMAEHSNRIFAMKSARDNADELHRILVVDYNKMRQAGITREVIELISSSENLKG
ncbi:ATPase, F1 complex, gamma subunit [Candidatus Omnitrophus magneticus]|uniref:ATP synthase gamma chain n=1 Tax=Candidatus Omnitrophus magneticus TaxID=1609969 RepID=A0A0F0CRP6_9BACT|nr:ATPase, F1 complex, gamma subunit [Candidatus Omnitrophus magneticus]